MNRLSKWLAKTPVFHWAYRMGGIDAFPLASKDIWETMEDEVDRRAEALSQRKLEKLLTNVDERQIVKLDARNGVVFIGDERPDDSRLANLKSEADFLLKSDIWKVISETPKALAQKSIFMAGDSIDDVKKSRSMLYTLDTQSKILSVFQAYQKK